VDFNNITFGAGMMMLGSIVGNSYTPWNIVMTSISIPFFVIHHLCL